MTSYEKLENTLRNERYTDAKAAADRAEQKLWELYDANPELPGLLDAIKLARETHQGIDKMFRVF
tara:strand:- start:1692 stop:1886 length:195 start_codon:yes stop_codon:yes gene_type:complete